MNSFEQIQRRMPHFFHDVDVLEYSFHGKSKSAMKLFSNSRYTVVDPTRNNLDRFSDRQFNVTLSVNTFQNLPDYMDRFCELYRVSSKFVVFTCSAPGNHQLEKYQNLTEADFTFNADFKTMFDTFSFDVDYEKALLFFWGVKSTSDV